MASNRKVEILKHISNLGTNKNNWTKELNVVSWNSNAPKYDIREWSENHDKMGRGVTLDQDEFDNLAQSVNTDVKLSDFDNMDD